MKYLRVSAMALALQSGTALLCAQSAVTLNPQASPGTGQPGVTTIVVTGYGFPSGTIPPANVTVTFNCLGGFTATPAAVQALFGSTDRVIFQIPPTGSVGSPTPCPISIAGSTATGATFSSGNTASLTINPAAQIASLVPNSAKAGQTLQVAITGLYTNFLQGSTQASFGPYISVGGAPPGRPGPVTVASPVSAIAQIAVGPAAAFGPQTVVAATGLQVSTLNNGFIITAPVLTVLHNFAGASDGANPKRAMVFGSGPSGQPALYGTTPYGGATNNGTAFSLAPPSAGGAWTETVLHNFTGFPSDGITPDGALAIDSSGEFYGTTGGGGSQPPKGDGTVFSLTPPASPGGAWAELVLHNFAGGSSDGANPYAGVMIGSGPSGHPVLYGTTFYGGTSAHGVVYLMTPPGPGGTRPGGAWTETILHKFTGPPGDGANPHTEVTPGAGGVLYGTTYNGGTSNNGTVYQLTPPSPGGAWTETVLYNFAGGPNDGANPHGDLVMGSGGVLYGTTLSGGSGFGTVFSLTPPASPGGKWTETVLYIFGGGTDAAEPRAALVIGNGGVLYGTTYNGGTSGQGTVFSLAPPGPGGTPPGGAWTETVLHRFTGADGADPEAALVMDSSGVLYGATYYGGTSNLGTIFSLVP